MKISFRNDYGNIGHPKILQVLLDNALTSHVGYSFDEVTLNLEEKVRKLVKQDVAMHIIVGGTLTNLLTISKALAPYEAVISVESGHINVHETGAVEGTGHKIITVKGINGKITPNDIKEVMTLYSDCHMVKPKMVYVSNSTEIGTVYNKEELKQIYEVCKENNLYLFLDGARLPIALTSDENDMTIEDIAKYTDVFYLGGAKNGLPLGEMLIIKDKGINENFKYHLKNRGGMVSKGFFLSYMFDEYIKNDFYLELALIANNSAKYLKDKFREIGVEIVYPNATNQIFVRLDNQKIEELLRKFDFEMWEKGSEKSVVRFVTSWSTKIEDCDKLLKEII